MNSDANRSDGASRIGRREAIKWMMLAGGALLASRKLGAGSPPSASAGYGQDPDLFKEYGPGDLWPLSFSPLQHRTAEALCGLILPGDERSPSAASLKVQDFIDEWISAPYPAQRADKDLLLDGLDWLEGESRRQTSKGFHELDGDGQRALCDPLCGLAAAPAGLAHRAAFFSRFRTLAVGGFYTTPEGVKDLQFMGDSPSATFDGPSQDILTRLGLTQ